MKTWRQVILVWACLSSLALAGQHVVVLLDDSGSMNESLRSDRRTQKIEAAKRALLQVLKQVPPQAQLGVLALNGADGNGEWIIPLGPLQRGPLQQAIERISAGGGTRLGEFMKIAADQLLSLRDQQRYGEYRLLIVSDGEANDPTLVELYLPQILARGITVDVIGVDMAQDLSLSTRVSRYRRADDAESLTQAIKESLAETPLDDQDPDVQSDFELLAALPDELALAAIKQLCTANNRPLETELEPDVDAGDATPPLGPQWPGPVPPVAHRGPGRLLSWVVMAIAALFVLRVIAQAKRSR